VYVVRNARVTGDATGGSANIQMTLDPNFVSMIGYVSLSITQTSNSTERLRFQHVGALVATMQETRLTNFMTAGINPGVAETWLPPAMLIPGVSPGTTSIIVDNVDTDVYLMNANIFLYDIRAMELFPIDLLVAARGGV